MLSPKKQLIPNDQQNLIAQLTNNIQLQQFYYLIIKNWRATSPTHSTILKGCAPDYSHVHLSLNLIFTFVKYVETLKRAPIFVENTSYKKM